MKHADGAFDGENHLGQLLGFTDDKFNGYLYKKGNEIWLSAVMSLDEGKGNFSTLLNNIEKNGFEIVVPLPLKKMQEIIKRKGFEPEDENEPLTIWRRRK